MKAGPDGRCLAPNVYRQAAGATAGVAPLINRLRLSCQCGTVD